MSKGVQFNNLKILVLTTLFPNETNPYLGVFVRERINGLSKYCTLKIIAPIAYFPLFRKRVSKSNSTNCEKSDVYDFIVHHPKFFAIPKLLKLLDVISLSISVSLLIKRVLKNYNFNIIDAHYAYPDGVAAALISSLFKVPFTITIRGSDINVIAKNYFFRCKAIVWALNKCDKVISVADSLKLQAIKLGIPPEKIVTISNGVDCNKFYSIDKIDARIKLELPIDRNIILSVGNITRNKGFNLVLEAVNKIKIRYPKILYIIIGGGIDEKYNSYFRHLVNKIKSYKMEENVMLVGTKSNSELYLWYNSADLFCLASESEGYPNSVLEALSCGIPVVSTNVGDVQNILFNKRLGIIIQKRNANEIAIALEKALQRNWDKSKIRKSIESKSWDKTAKEVFNEFKTILMTRNKYIS